jgi:hypothetical protein
VMPGVPLVKPVVVSSEVVEPDTKKIDDAVLALMYLTVHGGCRAWKSFDLGINRPPVSAGADRGSGQQDEVGGPDRAWLGRVRAPVQEVVREGVTRQTRLRVRVFAIHGSCRR